MDYYINLTHTSPPFLPKKGSFLYYCYRKLPQKKQSQLMIVENLQYQFITISELFKESSVAIKKLEWWIDEINKIFNGKPNHPVSIAMMQIVKEYNIDSEQLIKTAISKTQIIAGNKINNTQELKSFIAEQYGYFEILKGQILHSHSDLNTGSLKWLEDTSEIMESIRYIYLLLWHKNHHLYLLPGIDASTESKIQKERLSNIFQNLTTKYNELIQGTPSKNLNPILNRLKLHYKILKAMKKNGFNVEKTRIELSPLHMLFATR